MTDHGNDHRNGFGALNGVRVIEIASIGPGPFCGMMLSDQGADVLRIEREGERTSGLPIGEHDFLLRGRPSIVLDLKSVEGREACLKFVRRADILIEGFRPGVMERLGLGPEDCQLQNPKLVYGRVTGWGQEGPLAHTAGHDINYIAVAGALHAMGWQGAPPAVPLNLVGDYAGGSMLLAFGVLAALHEAQRTGKGRVVDAAIVDGVAMQLSLMRAMRNAGRWTLDRGTNILDGGAPFYSVYETLDGRHLAVGAIEERFWIIFCRYLPLDENLIQSREDPTNWPTLRSAIAERVKARSLGDWLEIFEGTDACVAPILDLDEAITSQHAQAREMYVNSPEPQPVPAPRLSRQETEQWLHAIKDKVALADRLEAWMQA